MNSCLKLIDYIFIIIIKQKENCDFHTHMCASMQAYTVCQNLSTPSNSFLFIKYYFIFIFLLLISFYSSIFILVSSFILWYSRFSGKPYFLPFILHDSTNLFPFNVFVYCFFYNSFFNNSFSILSILDILATLLKSFISVIYNNNNIIIMASCCTITVDCEFGRVDSLYMPLSIYGEQCGQHNTLITHYYLTYSFTQAELTGGLKNTLQFYGAIQELNLDPYISSQMQLASIQPSFYHFYFLFLGLLSFSITSFPYSRII